jgi:hypothetical protein
MNREFVNQSGIKILSNDLRTAYDSNVFSPCDSPRLLQRALHAIINKLECGVPLSLP